MPKNFFIRLQFGTVALTAVLTPSISQVSAVLASSCSSWKQIEKEHECVFVNEKQRFRSFPAFF